MVKLQKKNQIIYKIKEIKPNCNITVIEVRSELAKYKNKIYDGEFKWLNVSVKDYDQIKDKLDKYDGIFYDTHMDATDHYFFRNYEKWMREDAKMTFFNPICYDRINKYFKDSDKVTFDIIKTNKESINIKVGDNIYNNII